MKQNTLRLAASPVNPIDANFSEVLAIDLDDRSIRSRESECASSMLSSHFIERHGLIVIIAIGESLIAIGIGARKTDLSGDVILAAVLGLVVVMSFWLAYFDFFPLRARTSTCRWSRASSSSRSPCARRWSMSEVTWIPFEHSASPVDRHCICGRSLVSGFACLAASVVGAWLPPWSARRFYRRPGSFPGWPPWRSSPSSSWRCTRTSSFGGERPALSCEPQVLRRSESAGYSIAVSVISANRRTKTVAPICSNMSRASLAEVASS